MLVSTVSCRRVGLGNNTGPCYNKVQGILLIQDVLVSSEERASGMVGIGRKMSEQNESEQWNPKSHSVLLKAELHQIKFLISAVYLYIYLAQLTFPAVGK